MTADICDGRIIRRRVAMGKCILMWLQGFARLAVCMRGDGADRSNFSG